MGEPRDHHRPLSGGLLCLCRRNIDPATSAPSAGTLGAIATKNGTNEKVLVTNLHVVAGVDIVNGEKRLRNLQGGEEMYQPDTTNEMHKVGINRHAPDNWDLATSFKEKPAYHADLWALDTLESDVAYEVTYDDVTSEELRQEEL